MTRELAVGDTVTYKTTLGKLLCATVISIDGGDHITVEPTMTVPLRRLDGTKHYQVAPARTFTHVDFDNVDDVNRWLQAL